jgi:hypothetical protein
MDPSWLSPKREGEILQGEWRIGFRRKFGRDGQWNGIICIEKIQALHISGEDDIISWSIEASAAFWTNFVYRSLSHGAAISSFAEVCTQVQPKIKVFI